MQAATKNMNETGQTRHTITGLAEAVKLPRRTIQYWYDEGIVKESDFELARLLVPFAHVLERKALKILAQVLRQTVFEHELQTKDEARHFLPHVKAARAGKPAVLCVQFIPRPGTDELYTFSMRAGRKVGSLATWMEQSISNHGRCPAVVINLTEALRHGVPV